MKKKKKKTKRRSSSRKRRREQNRDEPSIWCIMTRPAPRILPSTDRQRNLHINEAFHVLDSYSHYSDLSNCIDSNSSETVWIPNAIPDRPDARFISYLAQRMHFAKANLWFPSPQYHQIIIQPIRYRFIMSPREAAGRLWQRWLYLILKV